MTRSDYSERDKVVRHNVYASVRKRDGLPHELFANYWRDVHATLCSRLPGLNFYVQQHFDRNHHANLWPTADGVARIDAVLDGSAELGFADPDGLARFGDAAGILYADERNHFSETVAYILPNGSITFADREEDGVRNGPDRMHRVHVYMNRRSEDASKWLTEASADLASHPSVQKWKLHLPSPYDCDMVETFFKTLKAELVWRTIFQSRIEAASAIGRYIDGFYNPVRRHSALDFISPLQFEGRAA